MNTLRCPRCGLDVLQKDTDDMRECPRCLAHSGGTLSVALEPRVRPRSKHVAAAGVAGRLARAARVQRRLRRGPALAAAAKR